MSTIASKFVIGILVSALALGSATLQGSIARAEEEAAAAATAGAEARERAAARWEAAVVSARDETTALADAARGVAADIGDLATAADAAALSAAVASLDAANSGRDIGAIAARRDELVAAVVVFAGAVAAKAESVIAANASADQQLEERMQVAISTVRAIGTDERDVASAFAAVRATADRVMASHQSNVAAAAAAAAAAASAAAGVGATARAAAAPRGTGTVGSQVTTPGLAPGWVQQPDPEPTIVALGDYRPGCDVSLGEWDWWYGDGNVYTVDPGYAYDVEIVTYEGRFLAVKSLPCVAE